MAELTPAGDEAPEPLREPPIEQSPRRRRRRRALVVLGLVFVVLAALSARMFVWPPLPGLPQRADAIIELAGDGDRDRVALDLARQHRAPVVVQSTVIAEAGTDRCLPPVPGVTIMCFHPDPATTRGEAEFIADLAAQQHWSSVILVTTPDQAWRARLRVERCFPGEVYVATTPLPLLAWPRQILYQWGATVKAVVFQRGC